MPLIRPSGTFSPLCRRWNASCPLRARLRQSRCAACFSCSRIVGVWFGVFIPTQREVLFDLLLPASRGEGGAKRRMRGCSRRTDRNDSCSRSSWRRKPKSNFNSHYPSHSVLPWRTVCFCLVLFGAVSQPDSVTSLTRCLCAERDCLQRRPAARCRRGALL